MRKRIKRSFASSDVQIIVITLPRTTPPSIF